jgi:peroxygenase
MTYDNEGRFRPQNFEDIFAKYDRENKGGLSLKDVTYFWKGQRMVFDFFGWSATILECE